MGIRKAFVALAAVVVLFGALSAPATAGPKPTGIQLNLFVGDVPGADEPFHVAHGFFQDPSVGPPAEVIAGRLVFSLDIDGVDEEPDGVLVTADPVEGNWLSLRVLFNFPDGLPAGTYEFTGHWWQPCTSTTPGCAGPGSPAEVFTSSRTVTIS